MSNTKYVLTSNGPEVEWVPIHTLKVGDWFVTKSGDYTGIVAGLEYPDRTGYYNVPFISFDKEGTPSSCGLKLKVLVRAASKLELKVHW